MSTDWRGLFDELRIPWRDRGPNTSNGNINIPCPWCRDDPSFHLSVAEERDAYFCYRDPNRHSGRNMHGLLIKLGVPRNDTARLLNRYASKARPAPPPGNLENVLRASERAWSHFKPLTNNQVALDYLASRGFDDPQLLAVRYDLRYAPEGTWAGRILIPYYRGAAVETWTGRAYRGHEPKYLMHDVAQKISPIYSPSRSAQGRRKLVLVEGPFDALKIAAAVPETEYLVVALCGKFLNYAKIARIVELLGTDCRRGLVALDADVPHNTIYDIISELACHVRGAYISRARLPSYAKDPGDISLPEIPQWLAEQSSKTT